jgi:iron complex transport system substrate-binding protein
MLAFSASIFFVTLVRRIWIRSGVASGIFKALIVCWLSGTQLTAQVSPLDTAQNFTITAAADYQLLTVSDGRTRAKRRYALVPRQAARPQLPPDCSLIRTPVQRVVTLATPFIGYLDAIGCTQNIVGVANATHIYHPLIQEQLQQGRTLSVQTGQSLNIEALLKLQPDLILCNGTTADALALNPQLVRSGLPLVITTDYLEAHPLARAEWLRFVAAFFERSAQAEKIYQGIRERYHQLASACRSLTERPTVVCNAPYAGIWHLPGGQSYAAQLISDAGGDYLWRYQTQTGAFPLGLEQVYTRAANAAVWLHPNAATQLQQVAQIDPRLTRFRAFQTQAVYNYTRSTRPAGGNDIWERGVVHADEVLADLIHIFHPSLAPDHQARYYQRLR